MSIATNLTCSMQLRVENTISCKWFLQLEDVVACLVVELLFFLMVNVCSH